MDFKSATDRLLAIGISLSDLAEEMGVSHTSVRQARMDPESPSYRRPPKGWGDAVKRLAERRGGELWRLSEEVGEYSVQEPEGDAGG